MRLFELIVPLVFLVVLLACDVDARKKKKRKNKDDFEITFGFGDHDVVLEDAKAGLGLKLKSYGGILVVSSVDQKSPASQSIDVGDVLVSVASVTTNGRDMKSISGIIRGSGDRLPLVLSRPDSEAFPPEEDEVSESTLKLIARTHKELRTRARKLVKKGTYKEMREKVGEAALMYRDAIKHFPQGPAAWSNLGRVLCGEAETRRVLPDALGSGEEAGNSLAIQPNEHFSTLLRYLELVGEKGVSAREGVEPAAAAAAAVGDTGSPDPFTEFAGFENVADKEMGGGGGGG